MADAGAGGDAGGVSSFSSGTTVSSVEVTAANQEWEWVQEEPCATGAASQLDHVQVSDQGLPTTLAEVASQLDHVRVFAQTLSTTLAEWYEKCGVPDTLQLLPMLSTVTASCAEANRLVVAGRGNVGKSTVANALLGTNVFWPTAKCTMTSCICETHYGEKEEYMVENSRIQCERGRIPKEAVRRSATSEKEEFQALLSKSLRA
ncbi:unnamed protein product [Effrenium voratum]|nr:unnamed protein product [Effrenium voratum]